MIVGITVLTYLSSGSMIKSLMMATLGLILGGVGMDAISGRYRFTYGFQTLADGVGLVPLVMGLFGVSEVLENLEREFKRDILAAKFRGLFPTVKDWKASIGSILRGTGLGFFLGLIPGGGAIVASFASYAIEKKLAKHPEEFGQGAIQGVAGPEAANNSAASGNFIPLLTLGIPCNAVMAILLGALMIHGLQPGPLLMSKAPDLFWGTIVSMYIGNGMLLVLNLPLIGLWVKVLKIPYFLLYPLILLFCLIGAYSLQNNAGDVVLMLVFGVVGYLMRKFQYDGAPLILAAVLGPLLEEAFRQSLMLSHGDFAIFVSRPISIAFLAVAVILLIIPVITRRRGAPRLETVKEPVWEHGAFYGKSHLQLGGNCPKTTWPFILARRVGRAGFFTSPHYRDFGQVSPARRIPSQRIFVTEGSQSAMPGQIMIMAMTRISKTM